MQRQRGCSARLHSTAAEADDDASREEEEGVEDEKNHEEVPSLKKGHFIKQVYGCG